MLSLTIWFSLKSNINKCMVQNQEMDFLSGIVTPTYGQIIDCLIGLVLVGEVVVFLPMQDKELEGLLENLITT